MLRRVLATFSGLLIFTCSAWAETILGRVVGIADGDTIKLLTSEKTQIKVRLYGIDAPEKNQAFGKRAKENLSDLVFNKEAKLIAVIRNQYGRTVAWVYVGDVNANEEHVKAGFAWWYQAYAKHETQLRKYEGEARAAKRGLWSELNPLEPWKFRSEGRAKRIKGAT